MALNPNDCIDQVIATAQGAGMAMSRADARAMLEMMDQYSQRYGDPAEAVRQAAERIEANKIIEKRNAAINLRNRVERTARINQRVEELRAAGRGDQSIAMAVRAEVRAINTVTTGGRRSAEAVSERQSYVYRSGLIKDLKQAGLLNSFRGNAAFRDDVGRELYELSKQDAAEPHRSGYTGNQQALDAAKIVNRYQELAKSNLNRAGAWIGDFSGYISRTTWDPGKVWSDGFLNFRNHMLENLDQERTFENVENTNEFLKHVFDNLSNGVHLSDSVGMKDPAFSGPGNMAKMLSSERILHFKDADTWLNTQKKYGVGNLATQVESSLTRAGKQQALMERWGTNPRAEFENDIQRAIETYQHEDVQGVKYLVGQERNIMNEFSYLDGWANRPANEQVMKITQGLRNIENMAHLGFVAFTHLGSLATKISELHYQGVGYLEGLHNVLNSFVQGRFGRGDTAELHDLLLSGFDGSHTHYMSRFTLDDNLPGMMSNATSTFMQWTGLPWLVDVQKAGARAVMARVLGRQVDREFQELMPETQRAFQQYGITENDWNALRSAPDHLKINDRTFLTPDAAHRAEAQPDISGNDLFTQRMRDDLAMKLHTYYGDVADRAIVTPGVAEKALFLQGTQPGTLTGEALRFISQFKMWAAADVRQQLGREWYGNADMKSRLGGILSLAAMSTALGYLRMTLTDVIKGANPRDPRDPKTMMAALLQGGGMGILGDFMFGNFSRNGQNLTDTLAGPVIGQAAQLATIYNSLKNAAVDGDTSMGRGHPLHDIGPELLRMGLDNTPFVNLFGVRTALNYMFLWKLQESMNPGFQRRREATIKRQTGQTFWLSPAANAH